MRRPKGQLISKCLFGVLNSSKRRTKLTILNIFSLANMLRIVSLFVFGRIENTINFDLSALTNIELLTRKLFKGGNNSRKGTIQGNTVIICKVNHGQSLNS